MKQSLIFEGETTMSERRRRGFTLLEVILALGLTGLILVALGMAVDFHFRVLDAGRAHVEEGQLARVLLRRIASDLRAAVQPSLSAETGSASTDAGDATQSAESTDSTESAGLVASAAVHSTPGIYGDSTLIQIDVSRLPRPYQLQEIIANSFESENPCSLSDVKTVTYFAAGSPSDTISQLPLASEPEGGLVRCEIDRAVAVYQAEQGGLSPADINAVVLAPEVAGAEFSYFDGSQWFDDWDTSLNGGLPAAVRVTLYITPKEIKSRRGAQAEQTADIMATQSSSLENTLAYTLLVNIPTAPPMQSASLGFSEGDESESGAEMDGGSQSGTGGSGSSGSGTGGRSNSGSSGSSSGSGGSGGAAGQGGGANSTSGGRSR